MNKALTLFFPYCVVFTHLDLMNRDGEQAAEDHIQNTIGLKVSATTCSLDHLHSHLSHLADALIQSDLRSSKYLSLTGKLVVYCNPFGAPIMSKYEFGHF
jgi:hypothetical protein